MTGFYVERWTKSGWVRETTALESRHVAESMKVTLAKRRKESVDNFSILVVDGPGR